MQIRPMGNKVVIEPINQAKDMDGGIALADVSQDKGQKGKVIAVGPGRVLKSGERHRMKCAVGETVLYPRYNVQDIKIQGKDYVVAEDDEVMCSVKDV